MAGLPDHLMAAPVGRERITREALKERQRERVLLVATEVFAKRGYPDTTVDHLVAAARIGVGRFYLFFENKSDCFLQAYERVVDRFWEEVAAAVPASASWPEQVCAALRATLDAVAADPLSARIALVEVQSAGPEALARYEQTHDRIVPLLRAGRALAERGEELPPTLEEATLGGVAWLLHQRIVMGEVEGIGSVYPDLVEVVLGPYLGEDEAARLSKAPV
jgi:AcrR family transcriptional regulator